MLMMCKRGGSIHDPESGLPRISIPRTPVNKSKRKVSEGLRARKASKKGAQRFRALFLYCPTASDRRGGSSRYGRLPQEGLPAKELVVLVT